MRIGVCVRKLNGMRFNLYEVSLLFSIPTHLSAKLIAARPSPTITRAWPPLVLNPNPPSALNPSRFRLPKYDKHQNQHANQHYSPSHQILHQ